MQNISPIIYRYTYIRICIYIHTHIHTHIHTFIHTYTYTYTHRFLLDTPGGPSYYAEYKPHYTVEDVPELGSDDASHHLYWLRALARYAGQVLCVCVCVFTYICMYDVHR